MPLMLMSRRVGFGLRISSGKRRLITDADIGRFCHQTEFLLGAGRQLASGPRTFRYAVILQLTLGLMIAASRVAVNHDGKGGSTPGPLVWDQGGPLKVRET